MINRESENKSDSLSYDEMQHLTNIIIESVNIELSRLINEKERIIVSDYLIRLYSETQLFVFFIPRSLELFSDYIQENAAIRDFILNLTCRVITTMTYNQNDHERLIKTIVNSINQSQPKNDQYSLLVKEINDSISINAEIVKDLLINNSWILIMYLLIFNLHHTLLFTEE